MTTITPAGVADVADDFWQTWLELNPTGATSIGDRRYDDRLDDPTPAGIGEARRRLSALHARAGQIETTSLDPGDATTHAALVAELAAEMSALDAGLEAWSVDPLEGPQIMALDLEAIQRVRSVPEGDAMVARWRALGSWLDAHGANLRRGLADGRVAVRTPIDKTIEGLRATLARPDDELPLLAPAREPHDDWPPAALDRFRRGLADAVAGSVRPALERFLALLEDEIRPAARPDERPGIAELAGGRDAYRSLIRVHTSLDLDPEAVHRLGLAEIERIDAELEELGGRTLGVRGLAAVLERLRADRALYFGSRDEVFRKAQSALARAREATPGWFGRLPAAHCDVVPMGAHEERHSTLAYYREPAVDGSRPGQYFINTWAPETRPRFEAEALAYHESIPGHHLQIAIGQELEHLPAFRRHLGPTAYFEGWGLYTERLSDEMGLYSDDLDRIGILSFDGWRASRLVLDTGIHALGWTRDEAVRFMTAHTALSAGNIANEVDRYIVWPGQALAYKIGQLEILRLRDEARARQGRRFDIRAFHDAVLGDGALGMDALRTVVERTLA